jgi:hypothetical protein
VEAEPEADAEEAGEEADDFDDDPQPARTTQASRGMAKSARKRRIKKPSKVVDVSFVSLLAGLRSRAPHRAAWRELPG